MIRTNRQAAIELYEKLRDEFDVNMETFARWLISDYMSGSDALEALQDYSQNELGLEEDEDFGDEDDEDGDYFGHI